MAVHEATVAGVAERLYRAFADGQRIAPVRHELGGDPAAAYAVQQRNVGQWERAGRRRAGAKAGLTLPALMARMEAREPACGVIFADSILGDGEAIPAARLFEPRLEVEVAFILGRDVTLERPGVVDMIRAVDCVVPAIEVPQRRYAGDDLRAVDLIADNTAAGFVLVGTPARPLAAVALDRCAAVLRCNGQEIARGEARNVYGNPMNALVFTARHMAARGLPLREGDLVMSGSLVPVHGCAIGDLVDAEIEGLGRVGGIVGG
ncbi:MAG: 2-keto-4-pentenoate hydratase [Thalassobaculales bacterium]